jgi:probable phosphoglycerate mutase
MGDMQGQPVKSKNKWVMGRDNCVEPESSTSFIDRMVSWWNKTILEGIASRPLSGDPYHILATTHGGVIGTMVRNLIQNGQVNCAQGVIIWFCGNTSITIIDVGQDGLGIVTKYGDVSHVRKGEDEIETNADEVQIKSITS